MDVEQHIEHARDLLAEMTLERYRVGPEASRDFAERCCVEIIKALAAIERALAERAGQPR